MRPYTDLTESMERTQDSSNQKTIARVSAIPPAERTPEDVLQLVQAVLGKNDWHTPQYLRQLEELPDMVKSLRGKRQLLSVDNTTLDALLGKAYYQLGEYKQALPLLKKAQQRLMDPWIDGMIEECSYAAPRPAEKETFRVLTAKIWEDFAQQSDHLLDLIQDTENRKSQRQATAILKRILRTAFPEPSFSFGPAKGSTRAWLQIDVFSKTELLAVQYFVRHAPKKAVKGWLLFPGWPTGTRTDLKRILEACHAPVYETVEPEDSGKVRIQLYCPDTDLSIRDLELEPGSLRSVRTLLGSLVQTTFVSSASFVGGPPPEGAMPLEDLPYDLYQRKLIDPYHPEAMEALERHRFPFTVEELPDEQLMRLERGWRQDVLEGYTVDLDLEPDYILDMGEICSRLAGSGAIPGFAVFPLTAPAGRREQILADLNAALEETLKPVSGIVLGYAVGTHFGYLDVLAFDLPAVQGVLKKLLQRQKFSWACWHSFFRFDRTFPLF